MFPETPPREKSLSPLSSPSSSPASTAVIDLSATPVVVEKMGGSENVAVFEVRRCDGYKATRSDVKSRR